MTDHLDSLERLAGLFQKGILSKEEFEGEKSRLLATFAESHHSETGTSGSTSSRWKPWYAVAALTLTFGTTLGTIVWTDVKNGKSTPNQERLSADRPREELAVSVEFESLADCRPGQQLGRVLGRMKEFPGTSQTSALLKFEGIPQSLPVAVGLVGDESSRSKIASLPLQTSWLGLTTKSVRTVDWDQGSSVSIEVSESLNRVKAVLENAGLPTLQPGKVVAKKDSMYVLLDRTAQRGVSFTCALVRVPGKTEDFING